MSKGYLSELFVSFQGEGLCAGRRQLFLRLSACHLRCRYCDTPGSLERTATYRVHGRRGTLVEAVNPVSPEEVVAHALTLLEESGGADGLSVTGGEPLLQAEFLAELLADSRLPRPRMLETSGTQPDKLGMILPVVDVVSMDIKLPSNTGESPFWNAHARFLAAAQGKAYVKILVDEATDINDVRRAAELVGTIAADASVFLQPITQPSGAVDIRFETLTRMFDSVRNRVQDVRVIPQTHKMIGIP